MRKPRDWQEHLLIVLSALYFLMAALVVPSHNRILLPIGGVALAATALLARRLGPADAGGQEPIAVWLVGFMVLGMPVAIAPAPREIGFATALIGLFCLQGVWAVYRFPTTRARRMEDVYRRVLTSVGWGLAFAAGFSVFATAIIGLAVLLQSDDPMANATTLLWVIAAYFAGGIGGGVVVGLMRPLTRWPVGAMLVGIPATMLVYGAVGVALIGIGDPEMANLSMAGAAGIGVGIGLIAGPMAGLLVKGMGLDDEIFVSVKGLNGV